jgi:hypothetical protein
MERLFYILFSRPFQAGPRAGRAGDGITSGGHPAHFPISPFFRLDTSSGGY